MIACWKFNRSAQVVSLGKNYSQDLNQLIRTWQTLEETPIVFLEQPDNGLWKKEYGQVVSQVINMCEKSGAPLWLSFNQKTPGPEPKNSRLQQVEARLEKFRKRPPLQWLSLIHI